MKIQVDLDPKDVWQIQAEAERMQTTPGEVLRTMLALRRENLIDVGSQIARLVEGGWCDADIAAKFGMTNTAVAGIRRAKKLKANKRRHYMKQAAA